jgi:hypothetical protein
VDVRLTVQGEDPASHLRSLQEWLAEPIELRGRVRPLERPPAPGTLGPVLDSLLVALGPGGVAGALATVVIAWIRHRQGEVTVEVTRPDGGSVKVSAANVRGMTPAQLRAQVDQVSRMLDAGSAGSDDGANEPNPGLRA